MELLGYKESLCLAGFSTVKLVPSLSILYSLEGSHCVAYIVTKKEVTGIEGKEQACNECLRYAKSCARCFHSLKDWRVMLPLPVFKLGFLSLLSCKDPLYVLNTDPLSNR